MKLVELLHNEDPALMEMATLQPFETGLDYVLWIGRVGGQHGPRIKVSNTKGRWRENSNFTMIIDKDDPKVSKLTEKNVLIPSSELLRIKKWIKLNFDDLMLLWYMYEHSTIEARDEDTGQIIKMDDVFDRLQKV